VPLLSLRQAMQLACTHFRLTPEEAARRDGARRAALGLQDRGVLRSAHARISCAGGSAHPAELCCGSAVRWLAT
jgi:imidazolonepropionase